MDTAEELRQLHRLEDELVSAFPNVPADKVKSRVEQTWMNFLHARVRDFVPLLVRRQVIDDLRRS